MVYKTLIETFITKQEADLLTAMRLSPKLPCGHENNYLIVLPSGETTCTVCEWQKAADMAAMFYNELKELKENKNA